MSSPKSESNPGIRSSKWSFRTTKIGTRLTIAFGILVVLLMISTFISLSGLSALNREVTRIVDDHLAALAVIQQLEGETTSLDKLLNNVVTSTADVASFREITKTIRGSKIRDVSSLKLSTQDSSSGNALREVLTARASFFTSVAKILEPLASEDSVTAMGEFLEGFVSTKQTYLGKLEALRAAEQKKITASRQEAASSSAIGAQLVVAVNVILAGVALFVGWIIARSVSRPLASAVKTANAIAAGNLTARIDAAGQDEVAELMNAMSNMIISLSKIVLEIRGSADAIMNEARETAEGNSNLSDRTQQQAETLVQTAATIDKFASAVSHNAQRAGHAKSLASDASNVVAEGGSAMQRAVETMSKVDASTKEIAQIVDIIESIAFQTNILALNAAVEAARAGDHGRGFAVVATEVRSLAQRAARSAKEIKTLIGASVDNIRTGRDLVTSAGSKIGDVMTRFNEVTDIVNEIALASSEQTGDVHQVNQAMSDLDGVTQQNQTLVQQARAATMRVEEQARNLVGLMGQFKLDRNTDVAEHSNSEVPHPGHHPYLPTKTITRSVRR